MTDLTEHRDQIIAERGWAADVAKITNTRCYTHSNHRSVLAYELSQLEHSEWTWGQIADCLGFSSTHTTRAAARHHEASEERIRLAREAAYEQKRAETYGKTP